MDTPKVLQQPSYHEVIFDRGPLPKRLPVSVDLILRTADSDDSMTGRGYLHICRYGTQPANNPPIDCGFEQPATALAV